MVEYERRNCDGLLLVSGRESSRKLIFGERLDLKGWHDLRSGIFRPDGFSLASTDREYAFSGIHVVGNGMIDEMERKGYPERFPVMDYYLSETREAKISGYFDETLSLIDIGKPETLSRANQIQNQDV